VISPQPTIDENELAQSAAQAPRATARKTRTQGLCRDEGMSWCSLSTLAVDGCVRSGGRPPYLLFSQRWSKIAASFGRVR
jgi:hypothetical protein